MVIKLFKDRGLETYSMAFRLRDCQRFIPGGGFPVGMTAMDIIGIVARRANIEAIDEVHVDGQLRWQRR